MSEQRCEVFETNGGREIDVVDARAFHLNLRDDFMQHSVDVFFEAGDVSNGSNAATTMVSVPTDAVVQLEGDTVVFRRTAAGALEPVPVRAGEAIGDRTVIREGLKPGDAVVVEGAFAVKAQMLKSQLGEE